MHARDGTPRHGYRKFFCVSSDFERGKWRTFLWRANSQRRYTLMREMKASDDGHFKLDLLADHIR